MTQAFIDYWLFIATMGAILSVIAGSVAAIWTWLRKK